MTPEDERKVIQAAEIENSKANAGAFFLLLGLFWLLAHMVGCQWAQ